MQLIAPEVTAHLDSLVPPRDALTAAMEDEARKTDFPIIGPATGHLCYLLTRISGARQVYELGSGFGYSTAWFARAVRENGGGIVHHVVWDEALSQKARGYLEAIELAALVEFHLGEAVESLAQHPASVDLVFCDIDKHGYPDALPVIEEKLRSGGLLIADNLLWSGRIFDLTDQTRDTNGIRRFTEMVRDSPKWVSSIVPIRDGVLVAVRS
jgi:predicted O-methyltransferase YrrM